MVQKRQRMLSAEKAKDVDTHVVTFKVKVK